MGALGPSTTAEKLARDSWLSVSAGAVMKTVRIPGSSAGTSGVEDGEASREPTVWTQGSGASCYINTTSVELTIRELK